jgi:hypothetical protein
MRRTPSGSRELWRPVWDHTLCAIVNDLRVYARHTRSSQARTVPTTCGNALPLFTGGQVVAGSHTVSKTPVSPTPVNPTQVRQGIYPCSMAIFGPYPNEIPKCAFDGRSASKLETKSAGQVIDRGPRGCIRRVPVDVSHGQVIRAHTMRMSVAAVNT